MAQSATTVTPPTPTPPTNFQFAGVTGPNPPNFTKVQVANPFNVTAQQSGANGSTLAVDGRPTSPYGVNQNPPPYADDGTGAAAVAFAANKSAYPGGTGATSGGTENTYPGTGNNQQVNTIGAVPASTTGPHEGAGLESVATQTYSSAVLVPGSAATFIPTGQTPAWAAGDPGGPMRTAGVTPALVAGTMPTPNQSHASSLSPAGAATITTLAPNNTASGGGTLALTVTGTNFTPQSVVYVNGVAQTTVYVSSTSLTVAAAPKKATAGTLPVFVRTGGVTETAASTWTFT